MIRTDRDLIAALMDGGEPEHKLLLDVLNFLRDNELAIATHCPDCHSMSNTKVNDLGECQTCCDPDGVLILLDNRPTEKKQCLFIDDNMKAVMKYNQTLELHSKIDCEKVDPDIDDEPQPIVRPLKRRRPWGNNMMNRNHGL